MTFGRVSLNNIEEKHVGFHVKPFSVLGEPGSPPIWYDTNGRQQDPAKRSCFFFFFLMVQVQLFMDVDLEMVLTHHGSP